MSESLSRISTIDNVEVNPRTGSMVVYHQEDEKVLESIDGALTEVASDLLEAVLEAEELEFPGLSIVAHVIGKFVGKANLKLSGATNNLLDLKILFPIGFFSAGLYQASRNRNWLGQVPAWVLFFYAYDAYMRFHEPILRPDSTHEKIEAESAAIAEKTASKKMLPGKTDLKVQPN